MYNLQTGNPTGKKPKRHASMLSFLLLTLLVPSVSAHQCVDLVSSPKTGICRNFPMRLSMCTSTESPTSEGLKAMLTKNIEALDRVICPSTLANFCSLHGGTIRPDACAIQDMFCGFTAGLMAECATDYDCDVRSVRCCSNERARINLVCIVNASIMDARINTKRADGLCRDVDCVEWKINLSASPATRHTNTGIAFFLASVVALYYYYALCD